ncbi:MAG TPA: ABC transporter permease [Pirellulales bacterium]|jgi:ABC-type antimicrobial peptide transport system permease subunit|nr:ABC transporter permease [Pirellulales bacterium]
MSLLRLALRSLAYHWRSNLAVSLGVMAATAVLTGALVVGDSVTLSLRHLAIERLGQIDAALVTPHFFREKLAEEVGAAPGFQSNFTASLPAIMLLGTLENPVGDHHRRAGNVAVLGVGQQFWQLGRGAPPKPPVKDEIVLNQPLANQLSVQVGDEVVLRFSQASNVPADSTLGRKTETVRSRRFLVSAIIPAEGLGRFGLRPTQQVPLNAFTAIQPLQEMLGVDGRVNAIFVSGRGADENAIPDAAAEQSLQQSLQPTLADYNISVRKTARGYFNITTDRMLLEPAVESAAEQAFAAAGAQPAFTYLANYILADEGRGKLPYSTVAAIDFSDQPPLGPLVNREGSPIGPLLEDEIVLNSWAADDFAAQGTPVKPGDAIVLTYFEPESTHGKVAESRHSFRLKDITPLSGVADDPNFTPEVKGVTDEASIADWNPPFPYDSKRVRATPPNNQDDLYWRQHRATPKAFIRLEQGRELWGSRFGNATSIRIPPGDDLTEQAIAQKLQQAIKPADLGFEFLPVKRLSLTAAAGTTPFAILFLGFSLFIIAAALLLVMLLFKLGVDSRAAELGILLAVGLRQRWARRMLLVEGGCVALIGASLGALAGIGYAWLMLEGLKTWWLGAISTPFLHLYVDEHSVVHGGFFGVLISLATIIWAVRQTRQVSVRTLLAGRAEENRAVPKRRARRTPWIAAALLIAAIAAGFSATQLAGEEQAGTFMTAGALVLAALLTWIWDRLRDDRRSAVLIGRGALVRLAWRSAARHPLRSTLTIALTAAACFLIVALSAFQLDAPTHGPDFDSGDGGYAFIAQSDQPIYQNLNSAAAREDLGFSTQPEKTLSAAEAAGTRIYSLRVQAGDDASCLNLYQPRQPRILGLPLEFIGQGGFAWTATAAKTVREKNNPWLLLLHKREANAAEEKSPAEADADAIPVVLDQNTALYSLHLSGGVGEVFEIDNPRGGKIRLRVAGLLANSIFQGDLLMSETNFQRLFPDTSGYRFFLASVPPAAGDAAVSTPTALASSTPLPSAAQVADALETALSDYGFVTQSTAARLAMFFAVQNTYLATFRSLGALGLLLGTFGLAAVQLRSVFERRGELALLQATGFRRRRLAQLVLWEDASLLVAGLGTGTVAALVTLCPYWMSGGAGIPWLSIGAMLAVVLIVGVSAGMLAVRAVLRAPLLAALRGN